jgi:flagellar hook-associated protein 1
MSVSPILTIARTALNASQISVQTTSHNIANVNTEGYSRQEAILEEMTPVPSAIGFMGNGVTVKKIVSYYNQYLQKAIASGNSELSGQEVYKQYLTRIEGTFNEDNSQLSQTITDFFNSWQELATDPLSSAAKQAVASNGENLSTVINTMYGDLTDLQNEVNGNAESDIDDINTITSSIASLNNLIFKGGTGTSEANDYMDQRNQLLEKLSGKLGINYFSDENGQITVLTTSGKSLVIGDSSWQLTKIQDPETGMTKVGWQDSEGIVTDITTALRGGSLGALIDTRDNKITGYIGDLNSLAKSIIDNVNTAHNTGNGGVGPDFFTAADGNYAREIGLSEEILDLAGNVDLSKIMVSSSADHGSDNDVALEIAQLAGERLMGGSTYASYAAGIVARIGQETRSATDLVDFKTAAMTTLKSQRASISGVSIDDEMANLIKFQNAYQAAARLYTVANEMLKTLMEAV